MEGLHPVLEHRQEKGCFFAFPTSLGEDQGEASAPLPASKPLRPASSVWPHVTARHRRNLASVLLLDLRKKKVYRTVVKSFFCQASHLIEKLRYHLTMIRQYYVDCQIVFVNYKIVFVSAFNT